MSADEVVLGVPNLFVQDWVSKHFTATIRDSLATHTDAAPDIRFVIAPKLFQESRRRELETGAEIVQAAAERNDREPQPNGHIRSDYTLDRFVVGPFNKLAHACAMEIIESRTNHLHPLFVHSRSGLGKTHLLQAIWHEIRRRNDGRTAVYVSAEAFTNQFVYAMKARRLDGFRHRYRQADILLLDDVHFLRRKAGLQEELLHTYDALENRKCQLVLASDVHPKMLAQVRQSLVNRFASGMVVRISNPDTTARLAILQAKAAALRQHFPGTVLRHVAKNFDGNVRELTGVLTAILAYAGLTNERISLPLARKTLARLSPGKPSISGLPQIEEIVARHFDVNPAAWRGSRLPRTLRFPRHVCMYLSRKHSSASCREIAEHFGLANHSTVVFSVKRVEAEMKKDRRLADLVGQIAEEIRSKTPDARG